MKKKKKKRYTEGKGTGWVRPAPPCTKGGKQTKGKNQEGKHNRPKARRTTAASELTHTSMRANYGMHTTQMAELVLASSLPEDSLCTSELGEAGRL